MPPWRAMPLVPLAAAFAGGVALTPVVAAPTVWVAWAGAGLLGTAAGAARSPRRPPPWPRSSRWPRWAPGGRGVAAARRPRRPPRAPRVARLEGRLAGEPTRWTAERARLLLEVERVDGETRSGRVQLTAYGVDTAVDRRAAHRRLTHDSDRPVGFRNPGTFDYGEYLDPPRHRGRRHRRGATGSRPLEPEAPPLAGARSTSGARRDARGAAAAPPRRCSPGSSSVTAPDLPADVDAAFRRAGVYHVLAVSGFNVALIASTVWALLTLAQAPRRAAALGAIVTVLGFAAVVGPEPSVVRATIMAVLVPSACAAGAREASVLNGLALAAIAILAVRPVDLHDPGFQLSFAATAGLVLAGGAPRIASSRARPDPRLDRRGARGQRARHSFAVLPITLSALQSSLGRSA